ERRSLQTLYPPNRVDFGSEIVYLWAIYAYMGIGVPLSNFVVVAKLASDQLHPNHFPVFTRPLRAHRNIVELSSRHPRSNLNVLDQSIVQPRGFLSHCYATPECKNHHP